MDRVQETAEYFENQGMKERFALILSKLHHKYADEVGLHGDKRESIADEILKRVSLDQFVGVQYG